MIVPPPKYQQSERSVWISSPSYNNPIRNNKTVLGTGRYGTPHTHEACKLKLNAKMHQEEAKRTGS